MAVSQSLNIAQAEEESEEEIEESEEEYEEESEEEYSEEESENPDELTEDTNPLNPAGDSLDKLIQIRFNEDLWTAMLGDLSCLDSTEPCVRQLQEMAIANSLPLQAIDQRIELINEKIEEARSNNQRTINLGVLEPAVAALMQIEDIAAVPAVRDTRGNILTPEQPRRRRGLFDRLSLFFDNPLRGINDALALIGVPLFRNFSGGDTAAQQRTIAIADLQIKVAEIENKRGELVIKIREQVTLQVLDFDQMRREFQISQEVARRAALRLRILEQNYRFAVGGMDTPGYLNEISALDKQKAQTFQTWARLRTQLTRIRLLVLGEEA